MAAVLQIGLAAQGQVVVSKSAGQKSSIDLSGFAPPSTEPAQEFLRTLQNDLKRSGWFTLAGQGQGEFRILGEAVPKGRDLNVKCQLFRTAEQRALLSKSYRGSLSTPRALAHEVADAIIEAATGHKGISGTRLLMIGTRSGKKELYLCDADGGGMRQLTHDRTVSMAPGWSPDGNRIIYTSFKQSYPDLYEIDLNSGTRKRVSRYSNLNTGGAISPDGRYAAVILSGKDTNSRNPVLNNPELCIKDLRSGRVTRLTKTPNAAEASPSWSPDGRSIVYVSDQSGSPQLYIISRDGGRPQRLTSRGSENVSPDWGPGGLIAYASRQGGRYIIQVINPQTREITTPPQDHADYDDPSWAPNGRHLAATRSQNYHSQVYILDTMGDSPVALTNDKGDWYSPAWSPDK
jgi:TolB protein